jgi:hypothetical protein
MTDHSTAFQGASPARTDTAPPQQPEPDGARFVHLAEHSAWALGAAFMSLAALMASHSAEALDCNTLPSPVYGHGGSSPTALVQSIAIALSKASPTTTIVYVGDIQCLGIDALLSSPTGTISGTATYWDAAGAKQTCTLPLTGQTVQFAVMNTTATACAEVGQLPANIGDFEGPVQAFDFVVPEASSQTTISAAAAYFVFGFGAGGQAAPWVDDAFIFKRPPTSGVPILLGLGVGVPAGKMKGTEISTSSQMVTAISTSTNPEATIGMLGDDAAQASLGTLNILAYQHYDQDCGYWPSSSPTSFDKRNVRDGHYFISSPVHFFGFVDGAGELVDPAVKNLIGYITGEVAPPAGVDIDAAAIAAGSIPDCAMEVRHQGDLGLLQSYLPEEPCGCFFDFTATGATTCASCATSGDCDASAPHCRHGYCEVH